MTSVGDTWVPGQYSVNPGADFRHSKLGPKGYKERMKRKRDEQEQLEVLHPTKDETAAADMEVQDEDEGTLKRRKADGVKFIPVSGRTWKAPAKPAGKIMKAKPKTSWEAKMKEKASRQNFLEQKKEVVEMQKEKKKAEGLHRKEVRERKKANQQKSEVVQKVKTSTVKRMMKDKKQRKLLKKADTN